MMMFKLFLLGTMLWLVLCILILSYLRKREEQIIEDQVQQIQQLTKETNELILFVNYSSPSFKEIDALLITDLLFRVVIVFRAPEWMIEVKRKKWDKHCILSASSLIDFPLNKTRILKSTKGRTKVFYEVPEYLELLVLKST